SKSGCAIAKISVHIGRPELPNLELIQRRLIWTHITNPYCGIPKFSRSSAIIGQIVTSDASEDLGKN
ncbi:unnamed protein product, partial [Hymenolepis diminuta]